MADANEGDNVPALNARPDRSALPLNVVKAATAVYAVPWLFVAYALNECAVPEARPLTLTVNAPSVPLPATLITPAPPISGSALIAVAAYTTPRSVTGAPP